MPLADYTFMDTFWTIFVFFVWIIWFWLLITVFGDVFRRRDIGGWAKTGWILFVILLPYLGVFVYLIAEHDKMAERGQAQVAAQQQQMDAHVRSVAGGGGSAASEIGQAKTLLDNGAITQAEFDTIKARALAA